MDPSAYSGLNMAVIGVTTVFLALSLLILVVTITARLVGGSTAAAPAGASSAAPAGEGESAAFERDELARVAVAAYALHEARRVSVRGPAPTSAWLRAGRQTQVDRMR